MQPSYEHSTPERGCLSLGPQNINYADHLPGSEAQLALREPECRLTPVSLASLDHLAGVRHRHHLQYAAELGLQEAFQSIAGKRSTGEKVSNINIHWVTETPAMFWVHIAITFHSYTPKIRDLMWLGAGRGCGWRGPNGCKDCSGAGRAAGLLGPHHRRRALLAGQGGCGEGDQLCAALTLPRAPQHARHSAHLSCKYFP